MAYALIALGLALGYLDYEGTANVVGAGSLLKTEMFGGTTPFYKWFAALFIVALLGYIPAMRPISTAMLILIIVAVILSHNSAFASLMKGL